MKRAVVIRTHGDSEIAGALVDGIFRPVEAAELEAAYAEIASLRAEVAELRKEVARLGVRQVRDRAYFANQMIALDENCPPVRESGKVAQALLIGWTVLTLAVREFYRRLDEWNREP